MGKRKSNLELLRIICMVSIVMFHIYTQTDAGRLRLEDGVPYLFIVFAGYGGRLVCNCFVMIGAWFLCDAGFKPERIVNLWLQVFFYAAGITAACAFIGVPGAGIVTLVQSLLPIMGRPVWFAAEYMCMLMLAPFMNLLLERSEIIVRKLLILFGGLIIICATLFPIEHTTPAFSELAWFCFLYMFVAYFKRHPVSWMEKKGICLLGAVLTYLMCVSAYIVLARLGMGSVASYYLVHYENAFSFAVSALLFYAFKNMDIGSIRAVNTVGESIFAVYIVHQTPCFYPVLWNGIFSVNKYVQSGGFIVYVLLVMAVIFAVSVAMDQIRRGCFERFVYTSRIYRQLCEYIGRFYTQI